MNKVVVHFLCLLDILYYSLWTVIHRDFYLLKYENINILHQSMYNVYYVMTMQ